MSNFYPQGGTGGSLCLSLSSPGRRGLAQMSGWYSVTAEHQLDVTPQSYLPTAVTDSAVGRGWGVRSAVSAETGPRFFSEYAPHCHGCVCEGERGRFFHLCCPVIMTVWKNCWCFVLFSLSRWAEEGSRGIWHRHGRTRDRAGGCGDTVPVQKIPEEKSGVPVLVATSELKTK